MATYTESTIWLPQIFFVIAACILHLAKGSNQEDFCVRKIRNGRSVSEGNCEAQNDNPVIKDLNAKLEARKWTQWSQWSDCSVTCGEGTRRKTRSCVDASGCKGKSINEETCNATVCPVWSQWEQWSSCSKTCGTGERTRGRTCNNGPGCIGKPEEKENCNAQLCPAWSQWAQWSTCSTICGSGERTRTRTCNNGPGCVGNSVKTEPCTKGFSYRSKCYFSIIPDALSSSTDHDSAKTMCVNRGAKLADIFNLEHENLVEDALRPKIHSLLSWIRVHIATTYDPATNMVRYSDGTTVSTSLFRWQPGDPSSINGYTSIIMEATKTARSKGMGNYRPTTATHGALCVK